MPPTCRRPRTAILATVARAAGEAPTAQAAPAEKWLPATPSARATRQPPTLPAADANGKAPTAHPAHGAGRPHAPATVVLGAVTLLAALAGCATPPPPRPLAIPAVVRAEMARLGVGPGDVAFAALPLGHRAAPLGHRAEVPMQPGSAMKLVTAVVALDVLGATHTGGTRLLARGPVEAGVLRGDLLLQGGADPDLGLAQLGELLATLRDDGVQSIAGDLLLDRRRYHPARLDVGLPPFDERPEGWWNVVPDALLLEGGLQAVEIVADAEGRTTARLRPAMQGVRVDASALRPTEGRCDDWDADWRPPIVVDEDLDATYGRAGTATGSGGVGGRSATVPLPLPLPSPLQTPTPTSRPLQPPSTSTSPWPPASLQPPEPLPRQVPQPQSQPQSQSQSQRQPKQPPSEVRDNAGAAAGTRVTAAPALAPGTVVVRLQGGFPRGCRRVESMQVVDRDRYAGLAFAQLWRRLDGRLDGRVRAASDADAPAAAGPPWRVLAERRSRPWGEVLRPLLKTSDNTLARLLFLEIGHAAAGADAGRGSPSSMATASVPGTSTAAVTTPTPTTATDAGTAATATTAATSTPASTAASASPTAVPRPATLDAARGAVHRWFADRAIAAPGLVVDNGSGLSRSERIAPLTLARLVAWTWHSRHAPDLLMALPVAGVDGTLRNRLKAGPAAGVARLKTGTLRNVTALAGVAHDARGQPWALVLVINHDLGAGARSVLDAFVDDFARQGPPAGPDAPGDAP